MFTTRSTANPSIKIIRQAKRNKDPGFSFFFFLYGLLSW